MRKKSEENTVFKNHPLSTLIIKCMLDTKGKLLYTIKSYKTLGKKQGIPIINENYKYKVMVLIY